MLAELGTQLLDSRALHLSHVWDSCPQPYILLAQFKMYGGLGHQASALSLSF